MKNTDCYNVAVCINQFGFRDQKLVSDAKEVDFYVIGYSFLFEWVTERFSKKIGEHFKESQLYNILKTTDFSEDTKTLANTNKLGGSENNVIISVCMENNLRIILTH